ncbi:MAG: carboxypeptidase regulatory-like domain-containing protein [Acidobacteria bacterium]|nr:carboxypeptidase regulatory-like domain-containing protein [Acidobacteriota bacterium]
MRRTTLLLALFVALTLHAATIRSQIDRNRYEGPLTIRLGIKSDDVEPRWIASRSLNANESAAAFENVALGTYVVLVEGAAPMQKLAIETGVADKDVRTLRIALPNGVATGRITRGSAPLANANVQLTNLELYWNAKLATNDKGEIEGPSWLDGDFLAAISSAALHARYDTDVRIVRGPQTTFAIEMPNHLVDGKIVDKDGAPIAKVVVALRSVTPDLARTRRVTTGPDGSFAFEGVIPGMQSLHVFADGYMRPRPNEFSLDERTADHEETLQLESGRRRTVEVVGADGAAVPGARLVCAADGRVLSVATTGADGRAPIATPEDGASTLYVIPVGGSLAVRKFGNAGIERVRVPAGSASLEVATLTVDGAPVAGVNLLMRYNGELVPPEVARELQRQQGASLTTNDDGRAKLGHIPPGTYEFWPYRSPAEADALMASADFEAPINVQVVTGENKATVRFQKRN